MKSLRFFFPLVSLILVPLGDAWAQGDDTARLVHAWGRFGEGSWKRVRVTNESLDSLGNIVTTVTETTTTLTELGEDGYTLRVEVIVDVAGQQVTTKPKLITRGFNGELEGQTVSVRKIGTRDFRVDDRTIPCELQQIVIDRGDSKLTTSVHVAKNTMPYVLRRTTVTTDPAGMTTRLESNAEVVEVERPYRLFGRSVPTATIKTVQNTPHGNTVTEEVFSDEIPGGVVSHVSTQTDPEGVVIRRSTLELLDYHAVPGSPPRRRLFGRRRGR